jgi:Carbohydrate family 9 binding domain-like
MRSVALLAACALVGAACSLDFDRFDPDAGAAGTDAALEGGPDATRDAPATEAEAATTDAPSTDVAHETIVDPCAAVAGTLVAPQTPGSITIDGDLSDWGSPAFTLLEASNAALIVGPTGTCTAANATSQCLVAATESAEVALMVDSANLYVGVRVTVPNVGGTSTTQPFTNDAVEIYLRGDATPTGDYTADDHQYIIDWKNSVTDYGPPSTGTGQANPPGVTSAVQVAGGNGAYVVEAKIALTELGDTTLSPGQLVGFDLGIDHGQGTLATRSLLIWWMTPHGTLKCTSAKCTGCNPDQPYCDTLDVGLVCAE